jgi:hypothetical protein
MHAENDVDENANANFSHENTNIALKRLLLSAKSQIRHNARAQLDAHNRAYSRHTLFRTS